MAKLYRSTRDLQHWYVHIPGRGWARFPAIINGWTDCLLVTMPNHQHLNRVPLWLAFNTGLLEALKSRDLDQAA